MKKIISIFILSTFAAATFAFSSPSKVQLSSKKNSKAYPDWIFNPYNYYNEAKYLAGVGLGNDINAAEEDAKTEILKVLKLSDTKGHKKYISRIRNEYNSLKVKGSTTIDQLQ